MDEVHRAYMRGRVQTADPLTLVCMLYDNALRSVKTAREKLAAKDIQGRSNAITKASDSIGALASALNLEEGGDIGRNLLGLYCYMQNRLLEANFLQSDAHLSEVQNLLATLQNAWTELAASQTPALSA